MNPEEQAELSARRAASDRACANEGTNGHGRIGAAERAVLRYLISHHLPGGLVGYWQLVEAEVRR